MDLIDMRNQVNIAEDKKMKFGLIVVDVFSRQLWARAMPNKTPEETLGHLKRILDGLPQKPAVISSDQGLEFTGPVEQELKSRGIGHKLKDTLDKNALSVVDRIIQALKKTIARMMAKKSGGTWVSFLDDAVKADNETPHSTLHGEAPADVLASPDAVFMLMQDNARKLEHNARLLKERKAKLQAEGAFRAPRPEAVRKFKRGYQATYGEAKKLSRIEGSEAIAEDGIRIDVKFLKPVDEETAEAQPRRMGGNAQEDRKRETLRPIAEELYAELEARDMWSMVAAARYLRDRLRHADENYDQLLRKARVSRLADVIRLFPEYFEFAQGPGLSAEQEY